MMSVKITKQATLMFLLRIVTILIGCLLIYGSIPKIRQPYDFLSSVYSYELVGPKFGKLVAMMLPWLDLDFGAGAARHGLVVYQLRGSGILNGKPVGLKKRDLLIGLAPGLLADHDLAQFGTKMAFVDRTLGERDHYVAGLFEAGLAGIPHKP